MAAKGAKKKRHRRRKVKFNGKAVHIFDCGVSLPVARIYNNEQVLWVSDGGEFAIVFQGASPFEHCVFVVNDHGATPSGRVIGDDGDYKYRVVGGCNGCDIDPTIHIGP
jgi:hypothetical protein